MSKYWFFKSSAIIQKCSEEKIHFFKGTIKVENLSAIPTDYKSDVHSATNMWVAALQAVNQGANISVYML